MSTCRTLTCREHVMSEQGCLERVLLVDTRHLRLVLPNARARLAPAEPGIQERLEGEIGKGVTFSPDLRSRMIHWPRLSTSSTRSTLWIGKCRTFAFSNS